MLAAALNVGALVPVVASRGWWESFLTSVVHRGQEEGQSYGQKVPVMSVYSQLFITTTNNLLINFQHPHGSSRNINPETSDKQED